MVTSGDTISVVGDFTTTSLRYNTITVEGSTALDTVDISGLTSAHRVVFNTNGGGDTIVGPVRPQDVVNGATDVDQVTPDTTTQLPASSDLWSWLGSWGSEAATGASAKSDYVSVLRPETGTGVNSKMGVDAAKPVALDYPVYEDLAPLVS